MKQSTVLISKLLEKRNITNIDELSTEEKATLEGYKTVLSGKLLTVEIIKKFCESQIKIIENKFAEGDMTHDVYHKACLHVYLNLLKVIEAPEAERESLERHLTQLIS